MSYDRCMPNTINDICQPLKISYCPKYYEINDYIPHCTLFNQHRPCLITSTINSSIKLIQHPIDLKLNNICKYPIVPDCSGRLIEKCPNNCYLDTVNNKCMANNTNTICGIIKPYFKAENNITCPDDHITSYLFDKGYYCIKKWYYG